MEPLSIYSINIPAFIYVPVLYFLWASVLLVIKKVMFGRIKKFSEKTATGVDDIFVEALDLPLTLVIFVSGAFVLDNIFQFTAQDSELLKFVDVGFKITAIVAIVMFVDRLSKGLITYYSKKVPVLRDSSGVMQVILRSLVIGLGVLILLDSFGVSITPILASLGIGSLAVALALQPTLENFFSGIQLIIDKPIAVGHFIRLESGEEGYVEKIGWRSTWIRMLPDNVVIIPNKVLVNARILNYNYPHKEMGLRFQVGVHYDSDLEKVEKVTIEVAENVLSSVQGGIAEPKPFIRYHTFNDFSIDFTVIMRVKEFVDSYLVKHEFIKSLHKRFSDEGIIIPYPIRTLDWNEGSGPLKISEKS